MWAVVVAQLVERSLPTTEVRGCYRPKITHLITIKKTKIKEKRGREWPIKKIIFQSGVVKSNQFAT